MHEYLFYRTYYFITGFMSTIVDISTALPPFGTDQAQIHTFMDEIFTGSEDERRRLKLLYERSGIHRRYSVIPDYNLANGKRTLYPETRNLEPFPSLEQRMQKYHEAAAPLALKAIDGLKWPVRNITHIITVSCTGMSAPGLDLELMEELQVPRNVHRTSVNFMGCYAAVHALKMADAICRSELNARVLLVSVELCTLHFQKKQDYDNLTANAIFGDGTAACLIVSDNLKEEYEGVQLSTKGFYAEVHNEGKNDMAWQLSSTGFLMTLSSYIPQLIGTNIKGLLQNAEQSFGIGRDGIDIWAIHPGGRKILEAFASQLELKKEALQHSYEVLNDFGNMSSATILFVLKRIMEDSTLSGNIFGAAFGPGLTMETFLMTKNFHEDYAN
jgi:alkylresorcinol/alkylpyrone synthase